MTEQNGSRLAAFKDGLSQEELELVSRLGDMPQDMRLPFAIIMLKREIDGAKDCLREQIEATRKPVWKLGLERVSYTIGGLLAGLMTHFK